MAPGVRQLPDRWTAEPVDFRRQWTDNQQDVVRWCEHHESGGMARSAISLVFGSLGNAIPFDFFKEVQVKTGGCEAEFAPIAGGVVNRHHQERNERPSGLALFGAQCGRTGLEGTWKHIPVGRMGRCKRRRPSCMMSESKAADRHQEPCFSSAPSILSGIPALCKLPRGARSASTQDGYDRKRRNVSYSFKGTGQLSSAHRINASFFGDPSHGDMGPQRSRHCASSSTSSFSELDAADTIKRQFRYDASWTNWLWRAHARAEHD